MKKFIKKVNTFIVEKVMRNDLMKHFFVGTLILFLLLAFKVDISIIFFISFAVGVVKEFVDLITKDRSSFLDVLYTVLPSVMYWVITKL